MAEGACRDQAVHRRAHGESPAASGSEEADRLLEERRRNRRSHDWEGEHRLMGQAVGRVIRESLENLLDDREAGHDVFERNRGLEIQRPGLPKHIDPDRGVDEDHERRRPEDFVASRRIADRSPLQAPDPRSSKIRRALARRTKSSSAISTAREYVFSPLNATASRRRSSRSTRLVRFMCFHYSPHQRNQAGRADGENRPFSLYGVHSHGYPTNCGTRSRSTQTTSCSATHAVHVTTSARVETG